MDLVSALLRRVKVRSLPGPVAAAPIGGRDVLPRADPGGWPAPGALRQICILGGILALSSGLPLPSPVAAGSDFAGGLVAAEGDSGGAGPDGAGAGGAGPESRGPGGGDPQGGPGVEVTSAVIDDAVALDRPDPPAATAGAVLPRLDEFHSGDEISALAPSTSLRPVRRDTWAVPDARWDDQPHGREWTAAVLAALRGPGAPLLEVEPRDIHAWCPGYLEASTQQRAAFWTGLISTLAWHESTYRPDAVGGGGRWFGLVQIAPGTARWRNCEARTGQALLDGAANLRCAVRIMGLTVPRDNVVAEGMQGVAADWGPFHSSRKREDMRNWVRAQDYCRAPPPPMRPVLRPRSAGAGGTETPDMQMAPVSGPFMGLTSRPLPRPDAAAR